MGQLDRITQQPEVMGGKACLRGMRVTVGMVVGQISAGRSVDDILTPDLDFSAILTVTHGEKPGVVQIRAEDVSPDAIGPQVMIALRQMAADWRPVRCSPWTPTARGYVCRHCSLGE